MVKIGAIIAPLGLLLMATRMPSPLHEFRKARAFSPETARRLSTLKLRGEWQVEDHLKSGLVVALGDGRYYLNPTLDRARQRRIWIWAGSAAITCVALAIWLL